MASVCDSVCVAVRIRPLVEAEKTKGCQMCLNVVPGESQIQIRNTDKAFTYNYVFPPDVGQKEFYNKAIKKMVKNVFDGYNVTILAYGQTGSGKTHSMGTDYSSDENMGVIPRAVHDMFDVISSKEDWMFQVAVSFMELYQEQLYDLLTDKQRSQSIVDIREDGRGIKIAGLVEKKVTNAEEALQCLAHGSLGRATGATAMNAQSSRSHAIFTISIHQRKKDDSNSATMAKFHFVDLAGSERSKKTQATGERFKEGININKGLLALGNVISQLGEGGTASYVGYRDSKLTRLLQDSLGGNSMTLMIACVSPADYNLDETISTLRYADRARKIKNKPVVNQDPNAAEIYRLNKLVQELRLALMGKEINVSCPAEHQELQEKNRSLQKKIRDLTEQLNTSFIEMVVMHERAELAEQARERIQEHTIKILEDCKQLLDTFAAAENSDSEYRKKLEDLYRKILDIQEDQQKASKELTNYNISVIDKCPTANLEDDDVQQTGTEELNMDRSNGLEEFDEKHEEHTLRQAERNNAVQNINRELAIKEDLVTQLLKNSSQIMDYSKELQEMEQEIKTLQAEKDGLLHALQNVQSNNASSKLAETRRKKVKELEKKIGELSRKCFEQNKVIEAKKGQDHQIKNLSKEIVSLKRTRVRLVKQMRDETDRFTKWKQLREKELNRLKIQDKKRVNEMTRLKVQHNKQEVVFKRRMEEAFAINKRLKEALDVQKKASQRRDKMSNSKDGIQTWVTQEMDVLLSTVDAEFSLKKLMQDRASLASQLEELKNNNHAEEEILELSEFLDLRTAQIADIQQKILESDQENRANTRWNAIHTMGDAKTALKVLFEINADGRKKECAQAFEYKELMEKHEILKTQLAEYEKKEKEQRRKTVIKAKPSVIVENIRFDQNEVTDDSVLEDDIENDPDWTQTPLQKRIQKLSKTRKTVSGDKVTLKRSSDGDKRCACKSNCGSRLCLCRKNDKLCIGCNCNPLTCQNKDKENASRELFKNGTEESNELPKRPRLVE